MMNILDSFAMTYAKMRANNPEWREGQTFFNALSEVRPHWAEKIRGTENDPFNNDAIVPHLWGVLAEVADETA